MHRHDRMTRRFYNRDRLFNDFDDGDDCYPEWFYDRGELPFRSSVCPD
jgi:hypothetical protein